MKTQIKLIFKSEHKSKLEEFITHLESLSDVCTFVLAGDALLLEFDPCDYQMIYYYTYSDWSDNNPIITLSRDCKVSKLSEWDLEQLEMKRFVKV